MKKLLKTIICFLPILSILFLLSCSKNNLPKIENNYINENDNILFTDSLGREVLINKNIDKYLVTGPISQIICFALCPDKLGGVARKWNHNLENLLDEKYYNLPLAGQLYGGKGDLNLEHIININPQVVIDIGENKKGMKEDLDSLQNQIGIPVVHIEYSLAKCDEVFNMLGKIFNEKNNAEILSKYCRNTYDEIVNKMNYLEKKNAIYVLGQDGKNVLAEKAYMAEALNLFINNLAKIDNPTSQGSGDEVDLEQIIKWNPDYVFFENESMYNSVKDNGLWNEINAIKNNNFYEVPNLPYNLLGSPLAIQQFLGMKWACNILYNSEFNYDINKEIKEFYEMFYHIKLDDEKLNMIFGNN